MSIYQTYLYDGRKLMMAGIKDSQTNLFGIIEKETLEASVLHKFSSMFNSPSLLGHMQLVESNPERIVVACTLKDGTNREMSIHSGPLYLISLTKTEKLEIQHLQYNNEGTKCEGFYVWHVDKDIKLIMSLADDGSVYMHSVGRLIKENMIKFMNSKAEEKLEVIKEESEDINETKRMIGSQLTLNTLSKLELNPLS